MHVSNLIKTIFICIVGLVINGCGSSPRQPEWVNKPSTNYPSIKYLSSVGEADSREIAASRARANLSQIFQVAIKDNGQDFSQATVSSINDKQQVDNKQRAARFVNTEAQHVLEGTEIIEYWQSEEEQVFSLAVLEKEPASQRFSKTVRTADHQIDQLIDYASNNASNPIVALRALEKARISQVERDNVNRNLMITAGKGINGRYSVEEIEGVIRKALSTLYVSINADDENIKAELESSAAGLGIQQKAQSSYVLSSKLDVEPLQQNQGWWWLRGSLELELENNGETIAKQRWPIKASSTEAGMVKLRFRDTVNNKIGSQLYDMLTTTPGE